jgi:DnaJ family protein A protein 2
MSFEYYNILGIQPKSSIQEVKIAYKKLSIIHHPDKGGDEKKFQEISNAYNILSNEDKKRAYDMNGEEGNGMNHQQHQQHHQEDIFKHFFGGRSPFEEQQQPQQCSDINHALTISLEEAYTGIKKLMKIKIQMHCLNCTIECDTCNSTGTIKNIRQHGPFRQIVTQACHICKGIGISFKNNTDCSKCSGKNQYENTKTLTLTIPSGIETGYKEEFDDCGEQPKKKNIKPGKLNLIINIEKNNIFEREQNNLIYKSNISFIDSVCGKLFKLNILNQETIEIDTSEFGIIEPLKRYNVPNKGMKLINSNTRGHLIIIFNVEYQKIKKENTTELREHMEKLL